MGERSSLAYAQSLNQMLDLWSSAHDFACEAPLLKTFDEAIERFKLLRNAIATWTVTGPQQRHQHSFLTLIDDSVLWVNARRDGGDVAAAEADTLEAYRGMAAEVVRLLDDVRRRRAADPEA